MATTFGVRVQHYGEKPQLMQGSGSRFDRKWQAVRYIRQQLEIARIDGKSVGEVEGRFIVFGEGGIHQTQFWPSRIEAPADKPIIFHPQLIPALAAGLVTETRRVFKEQPTGIFGGFDGVVAHFVGPDGRQTFRPRYRVGDRLWVKEGWATFPEYDHLLPSELTVRGVKVFYRADQDDRFVDRWRSPLFMPRWASRHGLVVVGVDVQQIQSITRAQAIASGISRHHPNPLKAYRGLWDSLNRKRGYGWEANSWTWVYTIQLTEENDNGQN